MNSLDIFSVNFQLAVGAPALWRCEA